LELLAALQFLTILPVKRNFTSEQIGRSTVWFPVVGFIIGAILFGLHYILELILPAALVNALLIAVLVILSGGLHLDGLSDTIDGLAGHRTPERRLEIMRDSHIGAIGAAGLFLFLIIEYVSLNSIPDKYLPFTLLLAPAVSRWTMVYAIFVFPYARPEGLGKAFKQAVGRSEFLIATFLTLLLAVILFPTAGPVIAAGTWIIISLAALYIKRQIGGLTGDTYGAINEIALITVLLAINMLAFKHWLL
jgi:adenosylcobinamide-GDP ribazoletransferase